MNEGKIRVYQRGRLEVGATAPYDLGYRCVARQVRMMCRLSQHEGWIEAGLIRRVAGETAIECVRRHDDTGCV